MHRIAISLITLALALAGGALYVSAHFVPSPCDFVTAGGFVFEDGGAMVNFGAHGGCKKKGPDAPFWGHINVVDHGTGLHINSTEITGYLADFPPAPPTQREICGFARTNQDEGLVRFRVRMIDNGEPGVNDEFGIRLSNGYHVSTRLLGDGGPGGGNIQLHKPNPSTPGPVPEPSEFEQCGDVLGP